MGKGSKKKVKRLVKESAREQLASAVERPMRQLAGSAVLVGELEVASKEITALMFESLARSVWEL